MTRLVLSPNSAGGAVAEPGKHGLIAPQGNCERDAKGRRQQRRRGAFRISEMRVDQVERKVSPDAAHQGQQTSRQAQHVEWSAVRRKDPTRMEYLDRAIEPAQAERPRLEQLALRMRIVYHRNRGHDLYGG